MAINPYAGENSFLARSARAKRQRRDRKGRFAWMGGAARFFLAVEGIGKGLSIPSRFAGYDKKSDSFDLELQDAEDIAKYGKLVRVPASKVEGLKAYLNLPSLGKRTPTNIESDVLVSPDEIKKIDAPSGWKLTKTENGVEFYESEDGWLAEKYSDLDAYKKSGKSADKFKGSGVNGVPQSSQPVYHVYRNPKADALVLDESQKFGDVSVATQTWGDTQAIIEKLARRKSDAGPFRSSLSSLRALPSAWTDYDASSRGLFSDTKWTLYKYESGKTPTPAKIMKMSSIQRNNLYKKLSENLRNTEATANWYKDDRTLRASFQVRQMPANSADARTALNKARVDGKKIQTFDGTSKLDPKEDVLELSYYKTDGSEPIAYFQDWEDLEDWIEEERFSAKEKLQKEREAAKNLKPMPRRARELPDRSDSDIIEDLEPVSKPAISKSSFFKTENSDFEGVASEKADNPRSSKYIDGPDVMNEIMNEAAKVAYEDGRFPIPRNGGISTSADGKWLAPDVKPALQRQYKRVFDSLKDSDPDFMSKYDNFDKFWADVDKNSVTTSTPFGDGPENEFRQTVNKAYAKEILGLDEDGFIEVYRNSIRGRSREGQSEADAAAGYASLDKNMAWDYQGQLTGDGPFSGRYSIKVKPEEYGGMIGHSGALDEFGVVLGKNITSIDGRVEKHGKLEIVPILDGVTFGARGTGGGPYRFFNEGFRFIKPAGEFDYTDFDDLIARAGGKDKIRAKVSEFWPNTTFDRVEKDSFSLSGRSFEDYIKKLPNGKAIFDPAKLTLPSSGFGAEGIDRRGDRTDNFLKGVLAIQELTGQKIMEWRRGGNPITDKKASTAPGKPEEVSSGQIRDLSGFKRTGGPLGSNEGGTYEDANGNKIYVKKPRTKLHGENEVLASMLYERLGVKTAKIRLGRLADGSEVTYSEWIESKQDLSSKVRDPEYLDKIQDGFGVDAWLANWDVAGGALDNIVTDKNGDPIRVDPGGALLFRARGEPKGDAFGKNVGEIDSLTDGSNPNSKLVFGSMTNDEKRDAVSNLLNISPDEIQGLVNQNISDRGVAQKMSETLIARRKNALDRFGLSDAVPFDFPRQAPLFGPRREPRHRKRRINGYKYLVDRRGVHYPSKPLSAQDYFDLRAGRAMPKHLPFAFAPTKNGNVHYLDSNGKLHWGQYGAAGALLRRKNPEGDYEYLMIQRGSTSTGPGRWSSPGGAHDSFDDSQNPEITAKRELQEEVGLDLEDRIPSFVLKKEDAPDWTYNMVVYDVEFGEFDRITLERDKKGKLVGDAIDATWLDIDEIRYMKDRGLLHDGFSSDLIKQISEDNVGAGTIELISPIRYAISRVPQDLGVELVPATMDNNRVKAPSKPFTGSVERELDGLNKQEAIEKLRGMEIFFIDFETNGIDDFDGDLNGNRPVQVGIVKVKDGKVIDRLNVYMNPNAPLGEWSSKNLQRDVVAPDGSRTPTLVTDAWLKKQISQDDALKQITDFMGENPIVGGQNVLFDLEILDRMAGNAGSDYKVSGTVDSMTLAEYLLPRYDSTKGVDGPKKKNADGTFTPSYSLGTITQFLGFEPTKWHSADGDAEDSASMLSKMLERAENDDSIGNDAFNSDLNTERYRDGLEKYKAATDPASPATNKQVEGLEKILAKYPTTPEKVEALRSDVARSTRGGATELMNEYVEAEEAKIRRYDNDPELAQIKSELAGLAGGLPTDLADRSNPYLSEPMKDLSPEIFPHLTVAERPQLVQATPRWQELNKKITAAGAVVGKKVRDAVTAEHKANYGTDPYQELEALDKKVLDAQDFYRKKLKDSKSIFNKFRRNWLSRNEDDTKAAAVKLLEAINRNETPSSTNDLGRVSSIYDELLNIKVSSANDQEALAKFFEVLVQSKVSDEQIFFSLRESVRKGDIRPGTPSHNDWAALSDVSRAEARLAEAQDNQSELALRVATLQTIETRRVMDALGVEFNHGVQIESEFKGSGEMRINHNVTANKWQGVFMPTPPDREDRMVRDYGSQLLEEKTVREAFNFGTDSFPKSFISLVNKRITKDGNKLQLGVTARGSTTVTRNDNSTGGQRSTNASLEEISSDSIVSMSLSPAPEGLPGSKDLGGTAVHELTHLVAEIMKMSSFLEWAKVSELGLEKTKPDGSADVPLIRADAVDKTEAGSAIPAALLDRAKMFALEAGIPLSTILRYAGKFNSDSTGARYGVSPNSNGELLSTVLESLLGGTPGNLVRDYNRNAFERDSASPVVDTSLMDWGLGSLLLLDEYAKRQL
jgi:DNA polymerase III epsilon subunit-like protein/8-oxo-dGTP pyrophosphatase MutT (NUDIX family)